jgi:hypothetical protein
MIRMVLRDDQWHKMEPHCPSSDRPAGFGNRRAILRRFRDWSATGVFERIFEAASYKKPVRFSSVSRQMVPCAYVDSAYHERLADYPFQRKKQLLTIAE